MLTGRSPTPRLVGSRDLVPGGAPRPARYPPLTMPSERVQRRIDTLLDQAEEAVDREDWGRVAELARDVLALDGESVDATPFLAMAERRLQGTNGGTGMMPAGGGREPEQPPLPTAFVAGRYQVQDLLGEGARKVVYRAHDTRLDRDVAFALIKTAGLDADGRARIQREAAALIAFCDKLAQDYLGARPFTDSHLFEQDGGPRPPPRLPQLPGPHRRHHRRLAPRLRRRTRQARRPIARPPPPRRPVAEGRSAGCPWQHELAGRAR